MPDILMAILGLTLVLGSITCTALALAHEIRNAPEHEHLNRED